MLIGYMRDNFPHLECALDNMGMDNCDEFFWPEVDHLYTVQANRDLLVGTLSEWGERNLMKFKG